MNFFINNWYLIVAGAAVLAGAGYSVYVFVKRPHTEQLKSVKEWMLFAVTKAEKAQSPTQGPHGVVWPAVVTMSLAPGL